MEIFGRHHVLEFLAVVGEIPVHVVGDDEDGVHGELRAVLAGAEKDDRTAREALHGGGAVFVVLFADAVEEDEDTGKEFCPYYIGSDEHHEYD